MDDNGAAALAARLHETDSLGCSSTVVPGHPFPAGHIERDDLPYALRLLDGGSRFVAARVGPHSSLAHVHRWVGVSGRGADEPDFAVCMCGASTANRTEATR